MLLESNKISHALLNQQTLFVGTIPGVCRENIRALLSMDNNNDDNGSSDSMVDQVGIDHDDQTTDFQNYEMSDDNEDDEGDNDCDINDNGDDTRRLNNHPSTGEENNNSTTASCSVVGDLPP